MSSDDLSVAQAALIAWPERVTMPPNADCSDACRRLLDAMADLARGAAGWRDVAALIRQVLLTSRITYRGNPQLSVPVALPWPTAEDWDKVSCSSTRLVDGRLSIVAFDWQPTRDDESPAAVELARDQVHAVYRDADLVSARQLPADPFWKRAHQYETYRGETQRQAARAAVLNESGALAIALPTGRGKTAVAWSKVLLSTHGVTIVVVPTVVLALDMERRTADAAQHRGQSLSPTGRYAYVGSLGDDAKKDLREQVRSGRQRLLYTSPEAFVTGLASAVLECAEAGYLQQIVVDEAHLVDQWGSDFRSEFQTMPGLIREAHEKAPEGNKPSVLLLSATLSQQPLDLLTKLFSVGGEKVELVWGSELRTEPAFFFDSFHDESARTAAILNAVSKLPRPLILYTTRVDDAERWANLLRAEGLLRVGCVTGKSTDNERSLVMERWRGLSTSGQSTGTSLDAIVGTSAFGLGLDMPNVRTVLHACLPETVDRYYQEVGRAGRDGRPSVAYLCSIPNDERIATRLSRVTMIGDELGWDRWRALLSSGIAVGPLRYRVRKSTLPEYMTEGYGRSARWNVRTLTLMAQADIIRLRPPQWIPDAGRSVEAETQDREAFYAEIEDFIEFELLRGDLQGKEGWIQGLGEVRSTVNAAQQRALTALLDLVRGSVCVGRVIARHYRVAYAGGTLLTGPVCRGCPACRSEPASSPGIQSQEPGPLLPAARSGNDPLASWRGDSPGLFIHYRDGQDPAPLFERLAQRKVAVFSGLTPVEADRLQRTVQHTPIVLDDPGSQPRLTENYAGPIAFALPHAHLDGEIRDRLALGLISYVVGHESTPDPDKPGNLLRDIVGRTTSVSIDALLRSI
ncbi:helicase [Mycobacterium sp. CBMA 234]|uniref:protein DpdF n=1 Tax=Mycolicibacterium sp. CBMA 234 TaxID=1918495 RepID=UPI0012DE2209|nr:protein DpdF [Mycolicibacterium sp. CBMA 234]MUL67540.1 helicase [Mycolicibacterium sp. CBMA 234]